MSIHRIKLTEPQPSNNSFSHQQSINQNFQLKHKKKRSLYHKPQRPHNGTRLKTDEKQPLSILKQQHINSYAPSINLAHSAQSASKLSRGKHKIVVTVDGKKNKKHPKHTISVINLGKTIEQPKFKGSSTVTKRKQSAADLGEKLKEKIQDFRIISNCLQQYVKEERKNNNDVNLYEIIKIIGAFNRSQIAPISKPLQKLIGQIVNSIQSSLPQPQLKSILKKSISFESPSKLNIEYEGEQVKNTVKKGQGSRQLVVKKDDIPGEVNNLEQNLGRLKYESNRLKYFLQEISIKGQQQNRKKSGQKSKLQKEKLQELSNLRQIAQQQARIIRELENSSEDGTYRSDSQI